MRDESCRQLTTRHWEMCRRAAPSDVSVPSALTCRLMDYRHHEAAGESTLPSTVYRQRPGLPGSRTHHLEQPAGQRDICPVSVNLPSAFKNISVSGLVALALSLIHGKLFLTSSGSWSDFITWTTLKIHDWLIDLSSLEQWRQQLQLTNRPSPKFSTSG